jgi:deferrochelatase/peroxidase EfeB
VLDREDIQGLVLSSYPGWPEARYFFVDFASGDPQAWLSSVIGRVTSAKDAEPEHSGTRFQIAFSARGLARLGLSPEAVATFSREFRQGMRHPDRARALGESPMMLPAADAIGEFDALLLSYARTPAELDEEEKEIESVLEQFELEASSERVALPTDGRDHFGFASVRSNPPIGGRLRLKRRHRFESSVPAGEFVFGYRNAYGEVAHGPRAPLRQSTRELPPLVDARRSMDLGRNGTYLALRKLAQDVAGFRRFTAEQGAALWPGDPAAATRLAARLVGRWPNGAPLGAQAHREPPLTPDANRFGYRDGNGRACPLGAHIRRANPRDSLGDTADESLRHVNAHRMLRRGRCYGPPLAPDAADDGVPRGLMFLAVVADLKRQFEFVHQSWLQHPRFAGLSHERDPLVGGPAPLEGSEAEVFSVDADPFRRTLPIQRFVQSRGGEYLFLPGLRALAYLAEG